MAAAPSPPHPASFRIPEEDKLSWSGNWDVKKILEFSESLYHVIFFRPLLNDLVFDCKIKIKNVPCLKLTL